MGAELREPEKLRGAGLAAYRAVGPVGQPWAYLDLASEAYRGVVASLI